MDVTQASRQPVVRIVDDDAHVREVLIDLLRSAEIDATGFSTPEEFHQMDDPDEPGCIVLDVHLEGANGLDLHDILQAQGNCRPVLFITGEASVPMSVRAMKGGALDFLLKPFNDDAFLLAVQAALIKDRALSEARGSRREMERLIGSLSPRERQVLDAVADGLLNKQIAVLIGISEVTVKLHRKNLMRKMRASSFADLIRTLEMLRGQGLFQA